MKCGRGHVNHTKKKKWSVGMPLFLRLQFKSITNFPAYLSLKCMRNLDFISKKKRTYHQRAHWIYSSNGWPDGRSWIDTDTASLIDEVLININIPLLSFLLMFDHSIALWYLEDSNIRVSLFQIGVCFQGNKEFTHVKKIISEFDSTHDFSRCTFLKFES